MKVEDAAQLLKEMYETAPDREKVAHVHLFGIRYADAISNMSSHELADRAGIQRSYGTEIRKGINLAKYVVERRA